MSRISQETIDRVKDVDILQVIGSYAVPLKKKGANYVAPCPFHNEKSGSFTVSGAKQIFKCFGCGESGNGVDFVMKSDGLDFPAAVEKICTIAGITPEYEVETEKQAKERVDKATLREALMLADGVYRGEMWRGSFYSWDSGASDPHPAQPSEGHPSLPGGESGNVSVGLRYLREVRGYDDDTILEWGLGWAPNVWRKVSDLLEAKKMLDAGEKVFLVKKKENGGFYDFFRGRVMFPIRDVNGSLIAFGGRIVPGVDYGNSEPAKYLNSGDSLLYKKSRVLYGLDKAVKSVRKLGYGILVEGNTDVISMHVGGLTNTVGTCGTALTPEHVAMMKRESEEWILMRDGDKAGIKALLRDIPMLVQSGLHARVFLLDEGEDPDSFVRGVRESPTPVAKGDHPSLPGGELDGETDLRESTTPPSAPLLKTGGDKDLVERVRAGAVEAVFWYCGHLMREAGKAVHKQLAAMEVICEMLAYVEHDFLRTSYIEIAAVVCKMKKADLEKMVKAKVKKVEKQTSEEEVEAWDYDWADEDEAMKYGFVERNDKDHIGYYFLGESKSLVRQTFYVLKPLYHVYGNDNRRIFEVDNGREKMVVEVPSQNVMSPDAFGNALVKEGTFIPEGTYNKIHHLKLLRKLLPMLPLTYELNMLGWQANEGFFAFSNKVYLPPKNMGEAGTLGDYNEYGVVELDGKFYLSPSNSKSNDLIRQEENIYKNDLYLQYKVSPIGFEEWCQLVVRAYENNGMMMIPFVIATLFRDMVIKLTKIPHLYAYGMVNAGKSEFGESISNLFFSGKDSQGELYKPLNLNQGTEFAFFNRMERFKNCPNLLNEFDENAIDDKYFRAIKAAYDGEGRTKGLKDKNRATTQEINCTLILMGQFLGTKDENSVLTRSIPLSFRAIAAADRPDAMVQAFTRLKQLEHEGLSGILVELMNTRSRFEREFPDVFFRIVKQMQNELKEEGVNAQPRILKNIGCMAALAEVAGRVFTLPFRHEDFYVYAKQAVKNMTALVANTSGVSEFWSMVEYLLDRGEIREGFDFILEDDVQKLTIWKGKKEEDKEVKTLTPSKNLLFVRMSGIHKLYQKEFRTGTGKVALNEQTLLLYMQDQPYYVGWMKAKKFKTGATSCYVFAYDDLNINLRRVSEPEGVEVVVTGEVTAPVTQTAQDGVMKFRMKEIVHMPTGAGTTVSNPYHYECFVRVPEAMMDIGTGNKIQVRGLLVVRGEGKYEQRTIDVIDYEAVVMGSMFQKELIPPTPIKGEDVAQMEIPI